ncbi:hypothetical protein Csa_022075, partial [Cucumis sativus]
DSTVSGGSLKLETLLFSFEMLKPKSLR